MRAQLDGWLVLIVAPSLSIITGMSCLGHKVSCVVASGSGGRRVVTGRLDNQFTQQEWRFVVYVVPLINLLAAFGFRDV